MEEGRTLWGVGANSSLSCILSGDIVLPTSPRPCLLCMLQMLSNILGNALKFTDKVSHNLGPGP